MKIIICGSRTFENMLTIEDVQEAVKKSKFKITEVVSGECAGPDLLGHAWADFAGVPVKEFPAKWDDISNCKNPKYNKYGKPYNPRAGFERNSEMIKYADGVIAFWDENSNGTEHTINEAKKAGLPVYYAKPNPEYIF